MSAARRLEVRRGNAVLGGLLGALIGAGSGPLGMFALGALGAKIGYDTNPERNRYDERRL